MAVSYQPGPILQLGQSYACRPFHNLYFFFRQAVEVIDKSVDLFVCGGDLPLHACLGVVGLGGFAHDSLHPAEIARPAEDNTLAVNSQRQTPVMCPAKGASCAHVAVRARAKRDVVVQSPSDREAGTGQC